MILSAECKAALLSRRQAYNRKLGIGLGIFLLIFLSLYYVGFFDPARLGEGIPSIFNLAGEMFPPDFTHAGQWVAPLFDTLAMSIAGTALAFLLSLPLAVLGAANTTPHRVIYQLTRTLLNGLRAIPELIMGIVFVAAVGFGALPGVLALALHSVGMMAKFFAESIEHADMAPIEAARAAGCSSMQVICHGVFPQVFPQLADTAIYRWEYNFRASTIMGMVGAGGIGFELIGSLRIMQYQEVSAILIVILLMVTLVDGLSAFLRRLSK